MASPRLVLLLLASSLLLLAPAAADVEPTHFKPGGRHRPGGKECTPTAERDVLRVQLDKRSVFCLRMPRLLKNPATDFAGISTFPRTFQDTCGMYGLTYHAFMPTGAGPASHVHWSDGEYFFPAGGQGEVLRIFTQAEGKDSPSLYMAGEVPGYNLPPISPIGYLDVPVGTGAYSPPNVPHSWKAATNMTNFYIFWTNGFVMEPSISIPQESNNRTQVLFETSLWASPTDLSSEMFGGPDFVTRGLQRRSPLTGISYEQLQRLQERIDRGEPCYPSNGMRP